MSEDNAQGSQVSKIDQTARPSHAILKEIQENNKEEEKMPGTHGNAFLHRHNRNGSYDSICCACYLTAATACKESELHLYENSHSCDPIQLYEMTEDSHRVVRDLPRITSAANAPMSMAPSA
jgi:hypothetical protein